VEKRELSVRRHRYSKSNLDETRTLRDFSVKPFASLQTTKKSTASRLLVVTISSVFVAGVMAMLLVSTLPWQSVQLKAVVGALLLTVPVLPILYFFSCRPLSRQARERLLAEGKLRQSEGKFDSLAENSPSMIFINKMGRIVYANKRCEEVMKFTKDEFYSPDFDFLSLIAPESRCLVEKNFSKHKSGEDIPPYEYALITKDQRKLEAIIDTKIIEYEGKNALLGVITDITERKRAEEALLESEERFRTLVENQGEGVGIVDPEERFIFANPSAYEIFGVQAGRLLGKSLEEFLDPDQFEIARKQTAKRRSGVRSSYELEFNRGDGEKRLMLVTATPLFEEDGRFKGVLGVFRDTTEMRKMEEEMVKAEKLESLGLLAGGIAHDFNNALTAILGNTSMLKAGLDKQDDIYSGLDDVEQAATQAQALTQQLLTFSRGGAPVRQTASIVELVRKTADFMLSGSNVKCEYSISDDVWTAKFDTGQIGQVFQNLIINADQAMPEGGIMKLSVENIYVGPGHSLPMEGGRYIRIAIQDQGTGIPGKYVDNIFDPFFTTKTEGNGLGLAIAYSVMKKHGGYIDVESQIGAGTTFYVYLPASNENPRLLEQTGEELLSGTGKILVVDDEEFIRDMVTRILTGSGYTVRCAADGARAIEMYKNEKELGKPFDAVLMDLTIRGGMGGKEAVKILRQIDPDVKVIVSSGYSNDPIMADHTGHGFSGRIAKPYRAGELNNVLSEVVNEKKLPI
jgi:PAS domain S-box-containing protein